ncbi:MAG: PAS domain S-box protein [Acidobacteria bacterium]|nr:PAS domain S-box protein [Acidobacteriota bacterium]
MKAPLPGNEGARIEALRRYDILDTVPEQAFDDLTLLAAQICEAPVALISFVDARRQWFKSRVGFASAETSREGSFCSWAITQPDLFIVPDALQDERFATNHLVTGEPPIRFYAAMSLMTPEGHALGTICVIDHVARDLNARQQDALRALGRQTMTQLELRRQLAQPAVERLRETESKYKLLVEQASDGIHTYDFDGNFIDVNPKLCEMLGYTREELLRLNVKDLIPAEDLAVAPVRFGELRAGKTLLKERRLRRKNGTLLPVEISGRMLTDGVLQAIIRDITERKQVEEERTRLLHSLEEERARLASLFTQAPAFVVVLRGPEHIYEIVNPRYMQLIGFRDVLGKSVREALPELEGQGYFELLDEVFRTGKPHVGNEMPVLLQREPERQPEERFLDFVYQPMFDADGSVADIFVHGVDITDRKRAEEALRESEEWLRAIFEASRDGILVEDDERIVYVNKSYTSLFGYDTPEELIGKHVSTLISTQDAERMLEFGRRRARGEPVSSMYEFKGKRKDGSLIDIEGSVSAPTIAGQTYITTFVRDIAERKRAEEALRRAKDELEERVAERTAELSLTNVMLLEQIAERERIEAALSESEARFRGVFENTTIGLYRTTPDGRILLANPAVLRILRYTSFEELAACDLQRATHALGYSRQEFLERLEREGEIRDLEAAWRKADGSLAFVRESAKVVRGSDETVLYYEGTIEDITERKHAEEALAHVRNRLMTAQEDERRHLSRELHDEAGQSLMAIAMRLQRLENQLRAGQFDRFSAREEIVQLRSIVQATQRDLRRTAHALHPAALEYFGLAKALGGVIKEVCADGHVQCSVDVPEDFPRFTPAVECMIYRIVQEAVTNVLKHANASSISLSATVHDGVAAITLGDDGDGFDVSDAKAHGGFGLISMRERAEIIGARLDISSSGKTGTMIKLHVPLEVAGAEEFKHQDKASGSKGEQDENENSNRGRPRTGTPEHRLTAS